MAQLARCVVANAIAIAIAACSHRGVEPTADRATTAGSSTGSSAGSSAPPRTPMTTSRCVIAIERTTNRLTIDGTELPDLAPARLRRVLGEPDRIERTTEQQRYEEYGEGEMRSSTEIPVTSVHYVYDRRGLVFVTTNHAMGATSDVPSTMLVFFANPRVFDNTAPPAVIPKTRGGCTLVIDGHAVDPTHDLRPPGITYRTERFALFGGTWGPTSIATVIDRVYTLDDGAPVDLYLDAPATGRASYAELRRR